MMVPGARLQLDDVEIKRLENWVHDEMEDALDEHQYIEQDLDDWDRAYLAKPEHKKKNFPWPGAANIEIPVIGVAVDSINARVLNTIFAMDPFWTVRALSAPTDSIAKPIEGYLDWSRKAEFNLYRQARTHTSELTKYGWAWYKLRWEVGSRTQVTMGQNGSPEFKKVVVRRPVVEHILCRDVIKQAGVEDETQGELIAHRVLLTDNQMHARRIDKIYDNVEEVLKYKEDQSERHEKLYGDNNYTSRNEKLNTIYEIQADRYFTIAGEEMCVPVTLTWHRHLRKFLRMTYSAYPWRTLRKANFLVREGRFQGLGIAPKLFQMQEEISSLHRQQVDNGTIANTRFFVGRKNAIKPGTQIHPGRFLSVNDVERDLKAVAIGDIYQSTGMLELRALQYAERSSGVSDYQLGRESSTAGSRATATGTMALIQEGNRRFDLNIRDARDVLSEIGRDVLLLNQMYRQTGAIEYFIVGSGSTYLKSALRLPPDFDVAKVAVELTASTATINREVEKQGLIALLGVTSQYYNQTLLPAAQILMNPGIPGEFKEATMKAVEGARKIFLKIVQDFDFKDAESIAIGLLNDQQRSELSGAPGNLAGDQGNDSMAEIPGNVGGEQGSSVQ
jgi:hypothetical protein